MLAMIDAFSISVGFMALAAVGVHMYIWIARYALHGERGAGECRFLGGGPETAPAIMPGHLVCRTGNQSGRAKWRGRWRGWKE